MIRKPWLHAIQVSISALVITAGTSSFAEEVHWGYTGEIGPEYWGSLSEEFATCDLGLEQSPINIDLTEEREVGKLKQRYRATPLHIVNNGHTIQVNYEPGSFLMIGEDKYQLLQFHFHTPSEHHSGGLPYPMEAHFVHRNDAGQLAVVGVFMEEGIADPTFAAILESAPEHEGEVSVNRKVNAKSLLPSHRLDYFNYAGSLTTPPCSEGVRWFVMDDSISVSAEQIEKFSHFVHGANARPVQPQNARVVYENDK